MYTVAIILLLTPIVLLILYYTGVSRTKSDDLISTARCDEMFYFIEDTKSDLGRSMSLYGKRAAVYLTNYVLENNETLYSYTFHPCNHINYSERGSEMALAELVICGTINGTSVPNIENETIMNWASAFQNRASGFGFNTTINITNLSIGMRDAFNFVLNANFTLDFRDDANLCHFLGTATNASSVTSIEGLEDPLYSIETGGIGFKEYIECDNIHNLTVVAGCSEDDGNGTFSGTAMFVGPGYPISNKADLENYASSTGDDISKEVVVVTSGFGEVCRPNTVGEDEEIYFNITKDKHFGGVIIYGDPGEGTHCITIPWIWKTGDIDPYGAENPPRETGCGDSIANITVGSCVSIKTNKQCSKFFVYRSGYEHNTTMNCYHASEAAQYNASCSSYPPISDGPSFFDRLNGNYTLSTKYKEWSTTHYGNPNIGLEGIVDLYELEANGVETRQGGTWVDYLYWKGFNGSPSIDTCESGEIRFRLDCQHAYSYNISTEDVSGSNERPTVTIYYPHANASFDWSSDLPISINATCTDCDGTVTHVSMGIENDLRDASNNGSDWNTSWSTDTTGIYRLIASAKDDTNLTGYSDEEVVIFVTGAPLGDNTRPDAPELASPENGSTGVSRTPTFGWNSVIDSSGIYQYEIQVDESSAGFGSIITDKNISSTIFDSDVTLASLHTYYWRVRAMDGSGNWGDWCEPWVFETA